VPEQSAGVNKSKPSATIAPPPLARLETLPFAIGPSEWALGSRPALQFPISTSDSNHAELAGEHLSGIRAPKWTRAARVARRRRQSLAPLGGRLGLCGRRQLSTINKVKIYIFARQSPPERRPRVCINVCPCVSRAPALTLRRPSGHGCSSGRPLRHLRAFAVVWQCASASAASHGGPMLRAEQSRQTTAVRRHARTHQHTIGQSRPTAPMWANGGERAALTSSLSRAPTGSPFD